MPRELYEQGSLSPEMEQMVQTVMKMTGVSREEAILMIQTMENPKEVTNDDFISMQEGYQLEPRQEYGLGSIVKSISKGVKKFAKSDLGKAALLYVGTAGNVKIETVGGDEVTLVGINTGAFIPVQVKKVFATGTTASNILALW